jgi:hypothetical protein
VPATGRAPRLVVRGRVIAVAGHGADPRATALVYVSAIPEQLGQVNGTTWVYENSLIHVLPDGTYVLDTRK